MSETAYKITVVRLHEPPLSWYLHKLTGFSYVGFI